MHDDDDDDINDNDDDLAITIARFLFDTDEPKKKQYGLSQQIILMYKE